MDEFLFRHRKQRGPQGSELDLFDEQPAWIQQPETDLERRFVDFHCRNPKVYTAIERKALELFDSGRTRIGIAELVEELRYDESLTTKGDHFKLNNSYRAFYARLLLHHYPKLAAIIATREQLHARGDE